MYIIVTDYISASVNQMTDWPLVNRGREGSASWKTGVGFQDLKTRDLTGSKSVVTQQALLIGILYNVY